MKSQYTLSEVKPRIFFLQFKRQYDLCMTFLRYQEFYESPKFRGKAFQILDFMEWYSREYGDGSFTYPKDWAGFNIPSHIIKQVWDLGIADRNLYDYHMKEVYQQCVKQYPDGKFYLIGTTSTKGSIMRHEIAHGMFYLNQDYRKEMIKLIKKLDASFYQSMCATLKNLGYCKQVWIDECQAYLSTGMAKAFEVDATEARKPFIEVFRLYYEVDPNDE
jgi:hypothetical protein